jgi:hypothetical protein
MLDPEDSAALREQLAAELKGIGSTEDATSWAQRVLAAKGTLQPGALCSSIVAVSPHHRLLQTRVSSLDLSGIASRAAGKKPRH